MSSNKVNMDSLADEILKGLTEYTSIATDTMKSAVKDSAKAICSDIKANAPKDTGSYSKSWKVKKQSETPTSVSFVIHSTQYRLTHLLENGHAKVNGGRVSARPHIAPAEKKGAERLEKTIRKELQNG